MCGIAGLYSFDGPAPHRALWPVLVNHLHHRGPDEGGWWADGPFFLGHRRLSIVGLATGSQPMATADGSLVVTFNGEIYNYPELRRELEQRGYRFRTDSDTEVLLHGYRAWGTALPTHLTGMFAFALADRVSGELFVARDRFGEKPLFLARTPRYLAFASELRPLTALPDLPRRLHPEALAAYMLLNYVPGRQCLLEGVERLPPATWRLYGPRTERSGRYWELPSAPPSGPGLSGADAVFACRARLDRAVRLNLRSDVPVGIFLSGGIDSSLVAESAMRQGRLNRAYCLDFLEQTHSEYEGARMVAERLGLELERVTLVPAALDDFRRLVEHADDPLADSSALAVWMVSRYAASRGNKVVLGGDGGDELFGGYLTYRASQFHRRRVASLPRLVRRGLSRAAGWLPINEGKVSFWYKLHRFLRAAALPTGEAHFSWNGTWLAAEASLLLQPGPAREAVGRVLSGLAARYGLGQCCDVLALQRADLQEYLPNDILTKTDRTSMAHGLETRAPFLEHEFAAWAASLPAAHKLGAGGELKTILRQCVRQVYGPQIADRRKQGFSLPIHAWMRGPFAPTLRELLAPASVARLGALDPVAVSKVLADHLAGRRSLGFELWGLAVLVAWHQARIERQPEAPAIQDLRQWHFECRQQAA